MYIKPTKDAKDLWTISEDLALEVLLSPKDSDVPCPWDADISVEGDQVIVSGHIAPGGLMHGTCVCKVLLAKFSNYFSLELPDSVVADGWEELLKSNGWEIL